MPTDPAEAKRYKAEQHRVYISENRFRQAVYMCNWRARRYDVPGKLAVSDWLAVLDRYGRRCLKCGKTEAEGAKLTPDHVLPLSRFDARIHDGERLGNTVLNLQPLCWTPCNSSKAASWADFRPTAEGKPAIVYDHGPVPEMPQVLRRRIKLKQARLAALVVQSPEEEWDEL